MAIHFAESPLNDIAEFDPTTCSWQVMVNWAGLCPGAGLAIYTFMVHSEAPLVYQLMEEPLGPNSKYLSILCISLA